VTPLLDIRNIGIRFGGLKAVDDFSLSLPKGGLYGLIGPNGAGKTTCFNLMTGVYTPDTGSIELAGRRLEGKKLFEVTQAGIARTFQNIRLFKELSVLENVLVACHLRTKQTIAGAILRSPFHLRDELRLRDKCMALLARFDLADRADVAAGNLAYGDQRRLEIARALATDPKVLLLDEPAAGMNPREKVDLKELIHQVLRDFDVAILLIEHDMGVVMGLCQHITVLDHGAVIARGTPAEIQTNEKVIEAYLGAPAHSVEEVIAHDLEAQS
jgi:branched-chain amino acid transport system ATP-binding protein